MEGQVQGDGRSGTFNQLIHCRKKVRDFPGQGNFIRDIPAGNGKIAYLFLQCTVVRRYYRVALTFLFWCVDGTGGGGLEEVQGDGGLAGGEGQGQAGLHAFSHMIMKY